MKNKKGFTLIELVSVLVILAILALIVTPLVLNIIRKARTAADKRSIDAYGRSIELAITDYLLDNGTFPTSIEELQVEYSGDRVVCTTTNLNSDSSIYLAECTVNNRAVTGYTYGKKEESGNKEYEIGDVIQYNGINYYVIENSATSETTVTMLKSEPLTVDEVDQYGVGHVNVYAQQSQGQAFDFNGYGGMQYYSTNTCGYNGTDIINSGCTTDYEQSEIEYVVDGWKEAKAPLASEARLITIDDLTDNLGYEYYEEGVSSSGYKKTDNTPNWVYNENYQYWTMSPYNDSDSSIWVVRYDGDLNYGGVNDIGSVVRPVITISKSAL